MVGNPPYVRSGDLVSLAPDIRLFEPEAALDGGPDGLAVFRRLMPEASRVLLRPGGSLIVEVGDGQAQTVAEMARAAGFCLTTVRRSHPEGAHRRSDSAGSRGRGPRRYGRRGRISFKGGA